MGLIDKMNIVLLACILVSISAAKISPFVPEETAKHNIDIVRDQYAKEKRDEAQALEIEKAVKLEEQPLNFVQEDETTERPKDDTNTVVPIVVGSILGGLIVVVLVSYFIVRARRAKE